MSHLRARRTLNARVDAVAAVPVLIRDRHLTVVASNPLARALTPGFAVGVNLARFAFIDSAVHAGVEGWEAATDQLAAMLRESVDTHRHDDAFRRIVGELSATSAAFSAAWARERSPAREGVVTFLATPVGALRLVYRERWLDDTQAEALMVLFGADPDAEERMDALASIVAGGRGAT